jgi:hypothetical protein
MLSILGVTALLVAQSATVAVFSSNATDPNTATPVAAPVTYSTPTCNQPLGVETPSPILNPQTGFWVDPANSARECRVNIASQIAALPVGGYKGAVRLGAGVYGAFSTAFAVAAQPAHPCDGPPPSSGATVAGPRTVAWCHSGLDANGTATTVTNWRVYDGATVTTVPLSSVTVGSTANAQGLRLYSTTLTLAAGSRSLQVAGVNAVGEGPRSPAFALTVTPPAAVPAAPVVRGVS